MVNYYTILHEYRDGDLPLVDTRLIASELTLEEVQSGLINIVDNLGMILGPEDEVSVTPTSFLFVKKNYSIAEDWETL